MIAKPHRWKKTALAVTTALLCLWGTNVAALSLGRITVKSALGEPLRAEIDIPDLQPDEAASLKVSIALPEAFQAAGLEYNPAMTSLQATVQRRTDGRAYIRLNGDRPINDPFVDMILEARWATGRIVRDYTMLFDPPGLRQAVPSAPTQAQVPTQPSIRQPAPPPSVASTPPVAPPLRPTEPRKSSPAPAVVKSPVNGAERVTVKRGDTAGKIAATLKPASVSLDQMLVALMRANPDAFIGGNVNRIKAGAVINIPTADQAEATSASEAGQIIFAQSKDFNDFRRKLASSAPIAQVAAADRKASGSVQAQVEDKKTVTTTPDKLTLTKGAVSGKSTEEQLAKERSAQEAASRAAEIAKNINDLSKLGAASTSVAPVKPAASEPTAAKPVAPATITAAVTDPLPPASAPSAATETPLAAASEATSSPAAPTTPVASAPVPAASAVVKPPPAAPVVPPELGLVDGLIENPLLPAGAIGLIALLAGFGLYRARQRKKALSGDSAFQDSHLHPDSFFGASGGQSVDTSDSAATGSSMLYSPSQLDAVDDVDPVAEADVYLAYGRDLQAEEILKDALRTNPERIAIHRKLLEIFAKRRDLKAFEETATLAFNLTQGEGSDWDRIAELGRDIDPPNGLYQSGGQPHTPDSAPVQSEPLDFNLTLPASASAEASEANEPPVSRPMDLDLDLDFSLDEEPASAIMEAKASGAEASAAMPADEETPPSLDLDFDLPTEAIAPFETPEVEAQANALEFSLPDLDLTDEDLSPPAVSNDMFTTQAAPLPAPLPADEVVPEDRPEQDLGMLEFDLGSLSLDLGDTPGKDAAPEVHEDPLATKLALAEEFLAIGDDDGARALIEEVISESTGEMKIKAQRALSNL